MSHFVLLRGFSREDLAVGGGEHAEKTMHDHPHPPHDPPQAHRQSRDSGVHPRPSSDPELYELVLRTRRGEERAMEELYTRLRSPALGRAKKVVCHADAEELVNEAMAKLFELIRGPSFREGRTFYQSPKEELDYWLGRVVTNKARSRRKAESRRHARGQVRIEREQLEARPDPRPAQARRLAELRASARELIELLLEPGEAPSIYYRVLAARYLSEGVEGLGGRSPSFRAIGQKLGLNEDNCRKIHQRGIAEIKRRVAWPR